MTENNVKPLNIDLSLKKNNVDEFFCNLSENPNGFKNKDFRYTLSLIYQLVEDEFEGIFLSPNSPVRNTDFFFSTNTYTSTISFDSYAASFPFSLGTRKDYSINLWIFLPCSVTI